MKMIKWEGKAVSNKDDDDAILQWEKSKDQTDVNVHKTQCAFQFSNSLMYDLED